ncbi:putative D-aminoacylase-like [Daphnia sinensis]|uniref:D-aminoacylase-like n=1 Tax=Daphnia sinensis TaxID=1820382 RepID=A0AAD5KFD3_9CRUS|nr:putative D-aminoacylase-like [Daphnia sinensis]
MKKFILFFFLFGIALSSSFSQTITDNGPEAAGFSSERLKRMDIAMKDWVDKGYMNGGAALIIEMVKLPITKRSTILYSQVTADLIIRNGKIIDGTGNSWYHGDVAVKDGKIIKVGYIGDMPSTKTIDAKGLIVAPGFIDVHGHIEGGIINTPTANNYIFDGVTTVITATLFGHNTVRAQVMKRDNRSPTAAEQKQMESLVEQAMKQGAVGISTGLIYIPGAYAKTDEVSALARAAAKYKGVYASHIRNEENSAVDAVNEAINIGKEANIPVQISHFKIGGKSNWGKSDITLGLVKQAREEGWDVTIDQYPYTASSTNLGIRLPDWAFAGGNDSLKIRLNNSTIRAQIKKEMLEQLASYKFPNYSYAVVANYPADTSLNGKNISESIN